MFGSIFLSLSKTKKKDKILPNKSASVCHSPLNLIPEKKKKNKRNEKWFTNCNELLWLLLELIN